MTDRVYYWLVSMQAIGIWANMSGKLGSTDEWFLGAVSLLVGVGWVFDKRES